MSNREFSFEDLKEKSAVEVEKYHEKYKNTWDDFVWSSNNGTLFHTRRFLSYHPEERFEDCSLVFKKDRKWLSILPAAIRNESGQRTLVSHPGTSMAGPVFKPATSLKDTFAVVEKLVDFAKSNEIKIIKLTLPPLIYHTRPGNYFDFALSEFGFTYLKREVSSVIPLDFPENEILSVFSSESRRAVRKALKSGVVFEPSEDYETFYAILENNLKLRHNVKPTHRVDELILLRKLFPGRIQLFVAKIADEIIAGIVVFECNDRVALAFYISHREDKQEYRGVNLIFYEFIRLALKKQIRFLDFGIFTVNMKPNWGLARFKESFGALGVFRDTLIKKI